MLNQSANGYLEWGIMHFKRGDFEAAIADFNKALRLDPNYSDAFLGRGDVRYARGDLDGAIADYDKAIHLNPNSINAYINRGSTRREQGDFTVRLQISMKLFALSQVLPMPTIIEAMLVPAAVILTAPFLITTRQFV